ncbi:MAG: hypothetical protein NT167_26690, partial [Verrucomicrobia bacterium]|nr:hypothetical protein [Verrucomicrobiota bacterium]
MMVNTLLASRGSMGDGAEGKAGERRGAAELDTWSVVRGACSALGSRLSDFGSRTFPAKAGAFRPRWQPSYFTVLAFAAWFVATWNNTPRAHAPLALAMEAALFILSIYLLGVPEISLLGQGYL